MGEGRVRTDAKQGMQARFRLVGVLFVPFLLSGAGKVWPGEIEPRWLIEAPTAGTLPLKQLAADIRFSGGNSLLGEVELGLWARALVSLSFGGQNLLGSQSTDWNPGLGVSVRLRILNETETRPALAAGFRSQGFGAYDGRLERYESKSLGLYAVFSRNYRNPTGQGGIHFGLNRSFEDDDDDRSLTGFVGSDLEFGGKLALLAEYHFAFNDDDGRSLGKGRGYLNVGTRWMVSDKLAIEFDLKDVLENNVRVRRRGREVRVVFVRG